MSHSTPRSAALPAPMEDYRPSKALLWTVFLLLLSFVAWAAWFEIDEITRADGHVIPVSRMQKIQSLEGGIVDAILVEEGQQVEAGQTLVRMDDTRFRHSLEEAVSQMAVLKASLARLQAEVLLQDAVVYPAELQGHQALQQSENALFQARKDKLAQGLAALERQISISQAQLRIIQPLVQQKAVSEMDALKLKQDIAVLRSRVDELKHTYFQDAYAELSKKNAELKVLEPVLQQRGDQLRRTVILSPVRGKVQEVKITTRGGVIQPGEPIMEIVPVEEQLLIEARILPRDVAFLVPGMPARVKITAYDHTMYGHLRGTIDHISADTIVEESIRGKEAHYKVTIRTEATALHAHGKTLEIIPGMVAEVDILNGKRTLLSYLLRPLLRASLR